jgi:hypothetical protein
MPFYSSIGVSGGGVPYADSFSASVMKDGVKKGVSSSSLRGGAKGSKKKRIVVVARGRHQWCSSSYLYELVLSSKH